MASAEDFPGRAPARLATDELPVAMARDLIDRAKVDAGAAQVAAGAGDYEVAYELLQDAVVAWNRASVTLLELFGSPVVAEDAPATLDLATDDRPPMEHNPADRAVADAPALVGSSGRQPADLTDDSSSAAELPKRGRSPDSFFRRKRRAAPRLDLAGGEDLVLDDLLAVYVHDDDGSEAGEYDAWVARLHEKRRQLRASVDEADRWRSVSPRTEG
jgi:hypothetical protein